MDVQLRRPVTSLGGARARRYFARWPYVSSPRVQSTVALVAARVESAVGHRIFDGAVRLVRMGAVGKPAVVDVDPQVAKEPGDLLGNHVPQLKLADAGSVHDIAARGQRHQLRRGRGVPSLLVLLADRVDPQLQPRFDRIEHRGFADAALPGDHRLLPAQQRRTRSMPNPVVAETSSTG